MQLLISALAVWFFVHVLWLLLRAPAGRHPVYGTPRSGKWLAFERNLIAARGGVCEACGGCDDLQGHHYEDFHAHPEKELDPDNVGILCGPKGRNCHLRIGHSFDYRAINPHAREDAARQRHRIKTRIYE